MVELHVFNTPNVREYRDLIKSYLGYQIKIKLLRDIMRDKKDIIPNVPDEVAFRLADILEMHGSDVLFVFESDSADLTA